MVFRSDPRAGYGNFDFNVEWFYQYLDERQEELIIKTVDEKTGKDFTEAELSQREAVFERYLERAVEYYIAYRIFGGRDNRIIFYKEVDLSGYESVYDLLYDCLLDFLQTYPDYFTLKAVECMECGSKDADFEAKNDKNKIVTLHSSCVPTYVEKTGDKLSVTY